MAFLNDHGQVLAKALPLFGAAIVQKPELAVAFTELFAMWAAPLDERESMAAEIRKPNLPSSTHGTLRKTMTRNMLFRSSQERGTFSIHSVGTKNDPRKTGKRYDDASRFSNVSWFYPVAFGILLSIMASISELRAERLKKLQALEAAGFSAYPTVSRRTHELSDIVRNFKSLEADGAQVIVAGRVMGARGQGALIFMDLYDGSAKLQGVIKLPESGEEAKDFFNNYVDVGDFIEVTGTLFTTKSGQESILINTVSMLSKALLPLPDKYHGIQDEELRLRERYLDILGNPELREMIERKAKFWEVVRTFLKDKKFLEVETPTLEVTTGGAEARPFATHHHDFDLDVFMRISVGELWQKRLMAAGFPRTYEIGRVYRNEGSSPEHVQEFTNCEFYMAYADYEDGMKLVEELYKTIATEVFGTTTFTTRGHTFNLADEWKRIDYRDEIMRQTGIDITTATLSELQAKADELKIKYEGVNQERLIDTLWKYCRKNIAGPAFLINHPLLVAPLAKKNPDGMTAQVFQPILAGSEIGKGYSELNDPVDQRERFNKQQELLAGGDEEAMMADDSFVEMLEHGMPPTCGFGFGERLFAFLSDKPIREVHTFPLVKPKA